jgi:hypothetical protein
VLHVSGLFATRLRVALAAWRSQHDVVGRNLRPIRLVQVLTDVDGIRVICAVPLNGNRPVIRGPNNIDAGGKKWL